MLDSTIHLIYLFFDHQLEKLLLRKRSLLLLVNLSLIVLRQTCLLRLLMLRRLAELIANVVEHLNRQSVAGGTAQCDEGQIDAVHAETWIEPRAIEVV